ncbi:non-ribosomal peptide synthetase [Streptomyces diastatochromogenes]|nr:non-ribosomal peptide synthetase [Streptomyces diastatochromogenes]
MADGYLGDEAETDRVFGHLSPDVPERLYRTGDLVRVDTSGRLRFLGRADDQVKLRGYRIELSAISDVLTGHPEVQDAVVVVTDGDGADKRLVAAVVLAPGASVDAVALRELLNQTLPSYMVPNLWAVVDRLPVTANGKVDRRALVAVAGPARRSAAPRRPSRSRGRSGPGRVDLERIAALFAAVIEGEPVTDVTEDTDFFVIGGNSLGAVRLVRKVKQELGATVRLRDFLLAPTPAGLSALIEKAAER